MKEAIRPIPPNRNISAGYNSSMPRENMYSRIYAANIPEPIPIDNRPIFNVKKSPTGPSIGIPSCS